MKKKLNKFEIKSFNEEAFRRERSEATEEFAHTFNNTQQKVDDGKVDGNRKRHSISVDLCTSIFVDQKKKTEGRIKDRPQCCRAAEWTANNTLRLILSRSSDCQLAMLAVS